VIASKIEHNHTSYGLSGKVIGTITDNGSNFVKAFSLYSVSSLPSKSAEVFTVQEESDAEDDDYIF